MTPQELKNSILQLAIQGKLVEQRAEEGTGAELLEKIFAEKNAEGAKGKGEKSHAKSAKFAKVGSRVSREEIPDDEKPFDIPESWEWARLGELGILKSGYAFKSTEYTKDGVQVVRISDLSDDSIGLKDAAFYPHKPELSQYFVVDGSFLICMTGSIGKMAWVKDSVLRYLNQRVGMFIPNALCSSAYLWFFLHTSYVVDKWIRAKTSTNGNIKNADIVELPIPLPPLAEQKRIVAKIEELLPLVDRYEKAWSRLEDFNKRFPVDMQKSLLQMAIQGKLVEQKADEGTGAELLEKIVAERYGTNGTRGTNGTAKTNGTKRRASSVSKVSSVSDVLNVSGVPSDEKPFDIPESWEWVRLGEVCIIARGGSPRPIKDYITTGEDGVNWIKIGDTEKNGKYICSTAEKIKPSGISKSRMVHVGDFLLTNSMSFGRPYILKVDGCIHDGWLVISQGKEVFNQEYLYWVLSSGYAYAQFCSKVSGAVVKNLNSDKVANSIFPLPPLAEQKRIVAKLEELLPLCERLKR